MKSKLILFLAILMAAVTTFLFYHYMQQIAPSQSVNEKTVKIVVAKKAIKKNEQLTAGELEVVNYPESGKIVQMSTKTSKVVGLYATTDIAKGEPIFTDHIQQKQNEKTYVSRKVTPGYRAVSVGVSYVQSVSNLIEPEDHVDVIASTIKQANQLKQVKTVTVVSNVKVLAVGGRMTDPNSKDSQTKYQAVTLELKPPDALKVIRAAEQGDIQLVLNSRLLPSKGGK